MKYWLAQLSFLPNMGEYIETICRHFITCSEHQNVAAKSTIQSWMLPEKSCGRLHFDHTINLMCTKWLLLTDAYSKYPCIHPMQSASANATINLLEEEFARFGYLHTSVTDNAFAFLSEEFQTWCKD